MPDRYAELASEICDRAFTPEEFISECNLSAIRGMAANYGPQPRTAYGPGPHEELFLQRERALNRAQVHRVFFGPLEAQKKKELGHITSEDAELVLKKSEIRRFAQKVGKRNGFALMKKGPQQFNNVMWKRMERTGVVGHYAVDTGGMNFPDPSGPIDLGFSFFLGVGEEPRRIDRSFGPNNIIRGLLNYDLLAGAVDRLDPNLAARIVPPEHSSAMAKLGVIALIRFFDLFLESLDAEIAA
ncbi:MAG: hypothetical protein JNM59_04725 [Hyphomonadaceae bacterium]|nr:hypothetical protein [Hyphomonadaceae bacterium]